MAKGHKKSDFENLPGCAVEYIKQVIRKMRYRRKVRADVQAELTAHFEDELKECETQAEKEQKAEQLIASFGDAKLLAVLLRRAKKRCRPLWRTVVARTFQTVGALLLCFILYMIWFSAGKPTISVDYLAVLNQTYRPKVSDEDNAWPHFENAASLFVKPNDDLAGTSVLKNYAAPEHTDFAKLPEPLQGEIEEWVRLNEPAWREFVAAASKPYCYREYGFDPNCPEQDKWMLGIVLPNLAAFRGLARMGLWRCRIDISQDRTQQALANCLVIAQNSRHTKKLVTLIEQLVGISLSRLAHEEIRRILDVQTLTLEQLKDLQQQLAEVYAEGYPLMNVELEKLAFYDVVQRTFTDGGLGGGHLIPGTWSVLSDEPIDSLEGQDRTLFMPLFAAKSMLHARRDETLAVANKIYDEQAKLVTMTPYQRRHAAVSTSDEALMALSRRKFFLVYLMMPAFVRISNQTYHGKSLHQATLTILALKRWRAEKEEYPITLDKLIAAGFLKELPMDPYSDKPLIYKKTDTGFVLYSVGPDFTDNGGEPSRDRDGRVRKWRRNGDTVFWPVPKPQTKQ